MRYKSSWVLQDNDILLTKPFCDFFLRLAVVASFFPVAFFKDDHQVWGFIRLIITIKFYLFNLVLFYAFKPRAVLLQIWNWSVDCREEIWLRISPINIIEVILLALFCLDILPNKRTLSLRVISIPAFNIDFYRGNCRIFDKIPLTIVACDTSGNVKALLEAELFIALVIIFFLSFLQLITVELEKICYFVGTVGHYNDESQDAQHGSDEGSVPLSMIRHQKGKRTLI